jgi:dihydroflavonol-4-reductase
MLLRVDTFLRAKVVQRVVLTSSVAAVLHAGVDGRIFTEADWNRESTLANAPYPYAKTEAEKWAWAFVKREGAPAPFQMNTINPSLGMYSSRRNSHTW